MLGHGLDVDEVRCPAAIPDVSHAGSSLKYDVVELLLVCWKPKRDESAVINRCQAWLTPTGHDRSVRRRGERGEPGITANTLHLPPFLNLS
jgi:hypothetical protein